MRVGDLLYLWTPYSFMCFLAAFMNSTDPRLRWSLYKYVKRLNTEMAFALKIRVQKNRICLLIVKKVDGPSERIFVFECLVLEKIFGQGLWLSLPQVGLVGLVLSRVIAELLSATEFIRSGHHQNFIMLASKQSTVSWQEMHAPLTLCLCLFCYECDGGSCGRGLLP